VAASDDVAGEGGVKAARASALLAGALAAAILLASAGATTVNGKARVLDGDTLEVGGQRWRLYGVQAPGLDQVCHRAGQEYACGTTARAVLWSLIGGREVSCAAVGTAGSAVAICTAGDTSLNEGMVAAGWALAEPAGVLPYEQLEQLAKAARRGLWSGEFVRSTTSRQSSE
jgi:endonuclease YncB( thermonuclease family)